MKSVVILISGRGSNMIRIAQACRDEDWPARIACVISNRPDAAGLAAASTLGLETGVVDHRAFDSRDRFDAALASAIDRHRPDLVVLAGFMRILGADFVAHYSGRLINIHPSLLPAFTGLHTHERVLAAGCKAHGATVHFVTAELDAGPIIGQAVIPVLDDDTAATLQERVHVAEHRLYPRALSWLVSDRVRLVGGVTKLLPAGSDARAGNDPSSVQPALQWIGETHGH